MLIAAASLAAVLASAAASPAANPLPSSPVAPLIISVTAAVDIAPSLVTTLIKESDAVWRAAGFRFVWQRDPHVATAAVKVFIGGGISPAVDRLTRLAWIGLDSAGMPEPKIYVSYSNGVAFLDSSRATLGRVDAMPVLQRQTYLARLLGRALAHEVGHFLLGTRIHAEKGLMRASHSAAEFFAPERSAFTVNADERQRMAARFTAIYVASRG
jgi:hypothetical protein